MSNIKEERRKKEYNDLYKELCRRYDGETADQLRKYHNSVNRQDVCSRSTKPETVTAKRSRSYKNPESAFSKIFSETFLLCFIGFFFIITVGDIFETVGVSDFERVDGGPAQFCQCADDAQFHGYPPSFYVSFFYFTCFDRHCKGQIRSFGKMDGHGCVK